jgi:hypothetical protein
VTTESGSQAARCGKLLAVNAVFFLLAWYLWDWKIMVPIKLLVVLMHEASHALAALLTGGSVERIQLDLQQAGVAWTRGGWRAVVIPAGYLGSTAMGLAIFYCSHLKSTGRHLMEIMGALILVVLLWSVRDPFTIAFCALTAGAFLFIGLKDWPALELPIARFIGVTSTLYALIDIRDDLLHWTTPNYHFVGGVGKSDAQAMSDLIPLPPLFWGGLWALISVAALLWVLSRIAAIPPHRLLSLDTPAGKPKF